GHDLVVERWLEDRDAVVDDRAQALDDVLLGQVRERRRGRRALRLDCEALDQLVHPCGPAGRAGGRGEGLTARELHDCGRSRAFTPSRVAGSARYALTRVRYAAATARRSRSGARNCPVYDPGTRATSSGVPVATTSPPASPPSGPRSTTQSAC